jgi:hypothetical protein
VTRDPEWNCDGYFECWVRFDDTLEDHINGGLDVGSEEVLKIFDHLVSLGWHRIEGSE